MRTANQFQQYSQSENTITNNVLLMLSSLYEINPRYYEEYVNGLIDESEVVQVIPSFNQQVNNNGNGYIDGHITTLKTSIIIETKINALESIEKLLKYGDSFRQDETSLLLHLSTASYEKRMVDEIQNRLLSNEKLKHVKFYSITYEDLLLQLNALHELYPYSPQLERLYLHFEEYCQNMRLLISSMHILRAMACGQSFDLNVKHQFYFDMADRGYSPFKYLGIYQNKSVRYIALVENIIDADWNESTGLELKNQKEEVTEKQKIRLSTAIQESLAEGWKIDKNHRFFLLKELTSTDYKKTSPGGIFRVRYFNLDDEFKKKVPETIKEVAVELTKRTWA
jgi:hypothetical protein